MAAPVAVKLGDFAYGNCEFFKAKAEEVKKDRDTLWGKKPFVQKVAYYAATTFAVAALIAVPASLALAAINFSLGYVGYAVIAGVALFVFSKMRGRFNSLTNDEEQIISKYNNPLGLDGNKDSVPEAQVLKSSRVYFESLVAELKDAKGKKAQDEKFKVAQKLFDKKIEPNQLKSRVATLAVTSTLLESIQHVYAKNQKLALEKLNKLEEGKLIELSSFAQKDRINVLRAQLKEPSKEFQDNLKIAIASQNNKTVFKMSDLDKALELAERYPKIKVAAKA